MSHEIRTEDTQEGRSMAWHKLTVVKPDLDLDNCHLNIANQNGWDVQPVSIVAKKADGTEIAPPKGDTWEALITEENLKGGEKPLFVSAPYNRETYSPLTNAEFIRIIRESLEAAGLPLDVESCGSVFNRRRVFLSIALPGGETFEAGGRQFKGFLNFFNSFDKSCEFLGNYSNICPVCNNTFNANLDTGGCFIPHTKNMKARLSDLPAIIAKALEMQDEFKNEFLKMAGRTVTLEQAKGIIVSFLCDKNKLSTRSFNDSEQIATLFVKGDGNHGENLADVFSAFTDFYSHFSAGEDKEKQFQSSEFGAGAVAKRDAFQFLSMLCDKTLPEHVKRGVELTNAYFNAKREKELGKVQAKLAALQPIAPPVPVVTPVVTVAPTPAPVKSKAKAKKAKGSK